jgi:hypothetical protein
MLETMRKYKKTTDVQRTWKEHGWTPPSEDPEIRTKWQFYRTLDTEQRIRGETNELPQV